MVRQRVVQDVHGRHLRRHLHGRATTIFVHRRGNKSPLDPFRGTHIGVELNYLIGSERDIFCYYNRYGVERDDLVELVADAIRVHGGFVGAMRVTESRSPAVPQTLRDIRRGDIRDVLRRRDRRFSAIARRTRKIIRGPVPFSLR